VGHYKCSKCGENGRQQFEIPALGHDYSSWTVTLKPTCTDAGKKVCKCNRCGLRWEETIKPLGHEWGEWYTVIEPSPVAPGLERRDCVREDIYEEREIPWEGGMPQLKLTVAAPGALDYIPGALVSFPFILTNVGDADCVYYYTSARYENQDNTTLWTNSRFKYAADITEGDPDLEANGGFAVGEFTVILPDVADADELTIVFTGYANNSYEPVDDPDYVSNSVSYTFKRHEAKLELTGTTDYVNPVLAANVNAGMTVYATNTGSAELTNVRITVTATDASGNTWPYAIVDKEIYYFDGVMNPAENAVATETFAVSETAV